jgi:glutamate formiminotransferase / 5-formyltetrahydrofolate cyclo-ligase
MSAPVLTSAVNVSEGKNVAVIDQLSAAAGELLLDVHRDPDHHRSVLTLAGPAADLLLAVRSLVELTVRSLDLTNHVGVHPRFGVVDVVPFSPVGSDDLTAAVEARDRLAIWAGATLKVPCFLYGPMPDGGSRSLPEVRRGAFVTLQPDTGPTHPERRTGAMAVGARRPLVAYNVWVSGITPADARATARRVRGKSLRALGLAVGQFTQVSCNLIEPEIIGPAEAYDRIAAALPARAQIVKGELVGLVPAAVLSCTPTERWGELGLSADEGLEVRLKDPSLRKRRS